MQFTTQYKELRDKVLRISEDREKYMLDKVVPIPERIVRCLWYDQRVNRENLKTVDGRKVEVISQGEWNRGGGPDFLDAMIRLEGSEPLRGNVEIHVLMSDWIRHGHHHKEGYENVILHVAMWNDAVPDTVRTRKDKDIAQVELYPQLDVDLRDMMLHIDTENYPFSSQSRIGICNETIKGHEVSLLRLLRLAGKERFFIKARRYSTRIKESSFEDALYRGLMEGMGYMPNKKPFKKLAKKVPYSLIQGLHAKYPLRELPYVFQSLFFHISGLYPEMKLNIWDIETREYSKKLNRYWEELEPQLGSLDKMNATEWVTSGVRPANFPLRRMAGMSFLLAKYPGDSLCDLIMGFADKIKEGTDLKKIRAETRKLEDCLMQNGSGYWMHHLTAGSAFREKVPALIGGVLARTLILNIVLPHLVCVAKMEGDEKLFNNLMATYEEFNLLDVHQITRLMCYRVWGDDRLNISMPRREIYQQGLLQVFFDFCDGNIRDCCSCLFPDMIKEYRNK